MADQPPVIQNLEMRLRRAVRYWWQSDEDLAYDPFRWIPVRTGMQTEEIAPGVRRAPIIYGEFTHPIADRKPTKDQRIDQLTEQAAENLNTLIEVFLELANLKEDEESLFADERMHILALSDIQKQVQGE